VLFDVSDGKYKTLLNKAAAAFMQQRYGSKYKHKYVIGYFCQICVHVCT